MKPLIPAVYGNYVWLDTNQNGLQDDGQTGVSGVRVDLYKDNGDGLSDPTTDLWVGFTVTDATGQYVFPALAPGDYFAVFSPPTGYTISPSNEGSDDALDSDGIVMPVTHLDSGETDLTWDLGIYLSTNCDVQITSYTISPCNWDGSNSTVSVNVFVSWANAPSGENIAVTLNGNTQTINVSGGATSPALITFTMPANNTDYTINAAFSSTSTCSDNQLIHTPLPCNPNVCVLSIDAVNVSACNSGNSTLDVVVSWTGSPSGENITVSANGQTQTINVSGGVLSPATVSFTVPADGSTNNPITAAFATTSSCSDNATYNARTCTATCSVTVDSAVPTPCDPADDTYDLAVAVTYANQPSGDITINVGGTNYTFTPDGTSPDTYTIPNLISDSTQNIQVSATFVGDATCTNTLVAYDAPAPCLDNSGSGGTDTCVVTITQNVQSTCNDNGTSSITSDDYFTITVNADGTTTGGSYEVVVGAAADGTGGNVLNSGGTLYGTPITVGGIGIFNADGVSTYTITIRDSADNTCKATFTTTPVSSCSSGCPTVPCVELIIMKL